MIESAVRHAISFVLKHPNDEHLVLLVQRPANDPDLPNAWGLPAGSVKPNELPEAAVARAGREKLGVELEAVRRLHQGSTQRRDYELQLTLFEARVLTGEPSVPQAYPEVTQYTALRWGVSEDLEPAAARGSLCCRLFLEREEG